MDAQDFSFGIETEFLLARAADFMPLTHEDLRFDPLRVLLDKIPIGDFSQDGLNIKPLHKKASPYLVEGYYLTDAAMNPIDLLPKGIEIRTPRANSIEKTLVLLQDLFARLRVALAQEDYVPVIVSHHPTAANLNAPANYARPDYWQWALTAATTFGPDINISVPGKMAEKIDLSRLASRVNYYMPAAIALTLSSPLLEGDLWRVRDVVGKSIRTYRRSIWAPLHYIHTKPSLRFEFKGFESALSLEEYQAYFLLSLAILLDENVDTPASDQTRIYDLGAIAVLGLEPAFVRERAACVLASAERTAQALGLPSDSLEQLWQRLNTRRLPADYIAELFLQEKSIPAVLRHFTELDWQSADRCMEPLKSIEPLASFACTSA